MRQFVLQTESLSKSFGKNEVLHDIQMSIEQGTVCGLIGQNGAGKTTLLRLINGLMKPTKGIVKLQTEKPFIGYMPQSCRFDDRISVREAIHFFSRLRNFDLTESVILGEKLNLDMTKKVKHLSPEQQKKLQMIIAMIGEPDFYILDEPTSGLNPNATFGIKNIIRRLHDRGKSILISSHILQDMDEICTNIAIMENGWLTYSNKIESCYIIKTTPVTRAILEKLSENYTFSADEGGTTLTVRIDKAQVPHLVAALNSQNIGVYEVSLSNVKNIVQKQFHLGEVQE